MSKITLFVGIDISKDTFDVYEPSLGHEKFLNNAEGFKSFKKWLTPSCWCVMENTGSYHQQLATFLLSKEIRVSVVNALVVKRFIQMKLQRNKTDKSDAKMIALYGSSQPLAIWQPDPEYIDCCKMLQSSIRTYFKQQTALSNKLHSLKSKGSEYKVLINSLQRQKKAIQLEIKKLEEALEALIKENESEMLTHITSIPGIGRKTAIFLIVSSNGFKNFESASQLKSFYGLAPTERVSGSSVKGVSRISKSGNGLIRNHLFMCSFTASNCNPACKALYQRIVAKGKSKKLALIAVCNKLVVQAFSIAKSGLPYDENYKSKLVMKN
jgi:transposase